MRHWWHPHTGAGRRDDPLWQAIRLLDVDRRRAVLAAAAGVGSLGSAVALAAVSAWLIARASQMPSVMQLGVAAVAVRSFGISRGVLRYAERLVSHDVALRGMVTLRARLYERLAVGNPAPLVVLRRGDLLARVGADVDLVGDVVVRGLLPVAVAGVLGLGSVMLVGALLPTAGVALAGCLALAGLVAPWSAMRAARTAEARAASASVQISATVMTLLDGADELRVARAVERTTTDLRRAERDLARATDASARPAALAAALAPLATGLAVLASLVLGSVATTAGTLSPVALAVVVLTPLAAFEATAALPAAGIQLLRSGHAAARITTLLSATQLSTTQRQQPSPARTTAGLPATAEHRAPVTRRTGLLEARGLACGWPGRAPLLTGVDLTLRPGRSIAVVGPSGAGKTTLLLTLAGLLSPAAGRVDVDGTPADHLTPVERAATVTFTPEDAHVFDTSLLENLRVARGSVTPDEATVALHAVGLGRWLTGLPRGLDTIVGSDATRISGGERRRLLVARALLSPAPLLLLDEPTEHVDSLGTHELLSGLLDGTLAAGQGVLVVTHRLAGVTAADEVILLDRTGTVRVRGHHEDLLAVPSYSSAWRAETQESR